MNVSLKLAEKIESYLIGNIKGDELFEFFDNSDLKADALKDNLHHLLADEDIRARDEGYKLFQENEAKKLVAGLRDGTEMTKLSNIDFLSEAKF